MPRVASAATDPPALSGGTRVGGREAAPARAGRRGALVLVAFFVLLAQPAHAGWKLDRAQAIAEYAWGAQTGCEWGAELKWERPADAFGAAAVNAWESAGQEPLMWTRPDDPAAQRCAVYINVQRVERWGLSWPEVCSAMLHEYGHLAGAQHSTNPRSIMYENYRPNRRCRGRGKPYVERHDLYDAR